MLIHDPYFKVLPKKSDRFKWWGGVNDDKSWMNKPSMKQNPQKLEKTRLFHLIIKLSSGSQRVNSGNPWCTSTDLRADHEWTLTKNKEERGTNPGFVLLLVKKAYLSCRDLSWGVLCVSSSARGRAVTRTPSPESGMLGDAVPTGLCQWHTDRQDYSSSLQDK